MAFVAGLRSAAVESGSLGTLLIKEPSSPSALITHPLSLIFSSPAARTAVFDPTAVSVPVASKPMIKVRYFFMSVAPHRGALHEVGQSAPDILTQQLSCESFLSQGLHRIDARRTPCRQPAGEQRCGRERDNDGGVGRGIGGPDAEEEAAKSSGRCQAERDTDR